MKEHCDTLLKALLMGVGFGIGNSLFYYVLGLVT